MDAEKYTSANIDYSYDKTLMGDEHLFWEGAGISEREWNNAWNIYMNDQEKRDSYERKSDYKYSSCIVL